MNKFVLRILFVAFLVVLDVLQIVSSGPLLEANENAVAQGPLPLPVSGNDLMDESSGYLSPSLLLYKQGNVLEAPSGQSQVASSYST